MYDLLLSEGLALTTPLRTHKDQRLHLAGAVALVVKAIPLPKIYIPMPAGNYKPDFGYVLSRERKAEALHLVVETKGYDNHGDMPAKERWKIDSAKQFFKALQDLPALKNIGAADFW